MEMIGVKNFYSKFFSFSVLYLIYFLVLLDWSIVAVLFAPLIVPSSSLLVSHSLSTASRNIVLGLLMATYPAAQFIGSLFLGTISDYYGRKKVLLATTLGTATGFALTAHAIIVHNLLLLFITRLVTGLFAGNMALSQAGVADLTDANNRGRFMAVFPILGGLSWTLGPIVATVLSNKSYVSWFSYATPFWFIAIAFIFCFFILWAFHETNGHHHQDAMNFTESFSNLADIFRNKKILPPYIIYTLMFFGWFLFGWFFSAFLIERFRASTQLIGHLFTYMSLWFLLGGLLSSFWFLRKFDPKKIIPIPLFLFALSVFTATFFNKVEFFWISLIFSGAAQAIVSACLYTLLSNAAKKDEQGKVFGATNSTMALLWALSPPIAGALADIWLNLPALIGGIVIFLAFFYFLYWKKS